MRHTLLTIAFSLLCVPSLACDSVTEYTPDDVRACTDPASCTSDDVQAPPLSLRPGSTWGPCDLTGVNEAGWWGCTDGYLGEGNACLRPVSDDDLSLCAPQTWDPDIDDDCTPDGDNLVEAPFGLGIRLNGSAYCVPDCMTDADCGPGRACSPASNFCAWVG